MNNHSRIELNDISLTSFWHCFGTERHKASPETVLALLKASRTNVLPINTHQLDSSRDRTHLEHGFGGVTYDWVTEQMDVTEYVKMLNINLRTSVSAALEAAKRAHEMTSERVFKLEVLTEDLRDSQDMKVVEVAQKLLEWNSDLIVLPLLTNNADAAAAAVDVGCPLVRIMGSKISSRKGIADSDTFGTICKMGVPVVLDGGVGSLTDLQEAYDLGARGVLVNSILFDDGREPAIVMHEYASTAASIF